MRRRFFATTIGVLVAGSAACSPGYMKASELEAKHQGPSDCEARCVELGMHMGALVLVSDTLPGCVCQPKPPAVEAPKPGEAPAAGGSAPSASADSASYLALIGAATAVRASETELEKERQKNMPK